MSATETAGGAGADRPQPAFHMTPDELRSLGAAVIDWVATYHENIESFPVQSRVEPGDIRGLMPAHAPEQPESFADVFADLERVVVPGLTHWQSPNFFAYFPANTSGPSILGELVSAGLGVQGMSWSTSPAATEVETHVLDWMVELLGLPERFLSSGAGGGVIQDSASSAALCAVVAARERATTGRSNRDGVRAPLVAYCSTQAHSSIEKAIRIAGIGSDNLRLIDVDDKFAMRADLLAEQVAADLSAGLQPFFVCATAGTTSSLAFDPVDGIGEICQRHGLWLHVDAAMAGAAAVCPELRAAVRGAQLADSWCFNPHKWLFVNFDCDCFYVADRGALTAALGLLPEYLRNPATESGAVIDYRDWQVPLGRRFRALKLWFVLRWYGAEGLRHHVRRHVELARQLGEQVEADRELELAAPVSLSLVCLRHREGNAATQRIIDTVNASGRAYVTHTRLGGKLALRVSIGQAGTEEQHVAQLWDLIRAGASPG